MAETYILYNGDGAQTDFQFSFPYISPTHVTVQVDGVDTPFTLISDYTVRVTPAPSNGTRVRVGRDTPRNALTVLIPQGGGIRGESINAQSRQALYIAQEAYDALGDLLTRDGAGHWDAGGNKIVNVNDPTDAQDVVTKAWAENSGSNFVSNARDAATDAEDAANNAETYRDAAQSARDSAKSYRDTAISEAQAAEGYKDTAVSAKDDAEAAETAAASSATVAQNAEGNAQSSANLAVGKASDASNSADEAAASALAAQQSETDAQGYAQDAQASAQSINLPASMTNEANSFLKVNSSETGYDYIGKADAVDFIGAAHAGHTHDGRYVNASGDVMTGNLHLPNVHLNGMGWLNDLLNAKEPVTVNKYLGVGGYVKFGNGFIIQWGSAGGDGTAFPVSFPSACISVNVTPNFSGGGMQSFSVNNVNRSSFVANRIYWDGNPNNGSIGSGDGFYYTAIGY